jgi:hypothetical protein
VQSIYGISPSTVYFMATKAYRKRLAERKHCRNAMIAVGLDDDEE